MIRIGVLLLFLSCVGVNSAQQQTDKIIIGDEQIDKVTAVLKGKRVALMVNYTAMIGKTHLADTLKNLNLDIKKIFSPEHGFRGKADAGVKINDEVDEKTGLPIVSLYGSSKKPTSQQLADIDVVVFDIQDVGTRFFTYISSLHYLMEACAENKKTVIVLDRPNPNGHFIDGPILQPDVKSFIGMHPIPITHGMTIGEIAQMINGEGWLEGGIKCNLEIVSMPNYAHDKPYLLPIRPSPNLPNNHAVAIYPSICLMEGTIISVGRGTQNPFELIGNPELKSLPFTFTPQNIEGMAKNPPHENKLCYGFDLRNEKPVPQISLHYLLLMYDLYPKKEEFFLKSFDLLAGTKELKEQIKKGMKEDEIKATWQEGLTAFKAKRAKYLLYPDH